MSTDSNSQTQPIYFYDPNLDERNKIDQEIADLEGRLQQLRGKRNNLLPIASLLPEILSYIFSLALITRNGNVQSDRLIPLTWVCHGWREIILGCPTLWSSIDRKLKERWVLEFLRRSGGAGLHISLIHRTDIGEEAVTNSLVSNFRRVVDLNLDGGHSTQPICNIAAPALQSLKFKYVPLPKVLFSGNAPVLKCLELTKCPSFTFSTIPPSSHLTDLRVVHSAGRSVISVRDCLDQLALLPALQSLSLDGVFEENPPTNSLPEIKLLHLQDLTLINTPVPVWLPFFTNISSQEKPIIRLDGFLPPSNLPTYLEVLSYAKIGAFNSVSLGLKLHGLSLEVFNDDGTRVTWIIAQHSAIDNIPILQRMPMSLHAVQRLSIADLDSELQDEFWSWFPSLHMLCLTRKSAVAFIKFVAAVQIAQGLDTQTLERHPPGQPARTGTPFLPALRHLIFQDLLHEQFPPIKVVRLFHKCFLKRKEKGRGLEKLVFRGLYSTRTDFLGDCAVTFTKEDYIDHTL